MSGHEAISILQKPVFGDPVHIYARNVLRVVEVLKEKTGKPRKVLMTQQIDINKYEDLLEDGSL